MRMRRSANLTDYQLDDIADVFIEELERTPPEKRKATCLAMLDAFRTKSPKKKEQEQLRVENPTPRTDDPQYCHITYVDCVVMKQSPCFSKRHHRNS